MESLISENSSEEDNEVLNEEQIDLMEMKKILDPLLSTEICSEENLEVLDMELDDVAHVDRLSTSLIAHDSMLLFCR